MAQLGRVSCLVVAFAVFIGVAPGVAWNNHGHMLVAMLAYQQLSATPVVRVKVDALVRLNPLIHDWDQKVAALPANRRAAALFAIAATWPDLIKSDRVHHDDGPAGGDRPPADRSAFANIGYGDTARHKYWHFIDTGFTVDRSTLPAVPVPNAVERIPVLRATLASPATGPAAQALKSYDLVWLLHLVGDLHQPLHAVTRVSRSQPQGDNGGNLVHLCAAPCRDELHGFWDGVLGSDETVQGIISTSGTVQLPNGPAANDLDPSKWALESLNMAQTTVYVLPIGAGAGPFTLNAAYTRTAQTGATARVALAAVRLANILKSDLK